MSSYLNDPTFLYVALILPGLFAATLIFEGLHKIFKEEPGWISFILGCSFLGVIIIVYLFLLR